MTQKVSLFMGGTGANSAADALVNLGAAPLARLILFAFLRMGRLLFLRSSLTLSILQQLMLQSLLVLERSQVMLISRSLQ